MTARFWTLAGLCAALLLGACERAQPVNVQDAAQVRAVVRDYLINDPTVLREALDALADRDAAALRPGLENDQRDVRDGPAQAPITIVEFFDYRCPYCHRAMEWLLETQREQGARVVFIEYPLLGPASVEAARAALAARRQNRYLPFHQALMAFRGDLTSAQIDRLAAQAGVDVRRMRRDMADPAIDEHLSDNLRRGQAHGVEGTPGFFINGRRVDGFDRATLDATVARLRRAG